MVANSILSKRKGITCHNENGSQIEKKMGALIDIFTCLMEATDIELKGAMS